MNIYTKRIVIGSERKQEWKKWQNGNEWTIEMKKKMDIIIAESDKLQYTHKMESIQNR